MVHHEAFVHIRVELTFVSCMGASDLPLMHWYPISIQRSAFGVRISHHSDP